MFARVALKLQSAKQFGMVHKQILYSITFCFTSGARCAQGGLVPRLSLLGPFGWGFGMYERMSHAGPLGNNKIVHTVGGCFDVLILLRILRLPLS